MKSVFRYKLSSIFVLSLMSIILTACSNDSDSDANGYAHVEVINAKGEPVPNQAIQVFNEIDFEKFSKDNTIMPTDYCFTGKNGKVVYEIDRFKWFKGSKNTMITFVVQFGAGKDNYAIWSSGKTFRPGQTQNISLKLE